jgi:hypothetical protein
MALRLALSAGVETNWRKRRSSSRSQTVLTNAGATAVRNAEAVGSFISIQKGCE